VKDFGKANLIEFEKLREEIELPVDESLLDELSL
jgi:hypothetical protein